MIAREITLTDGVVLLRPPEAGDAGAIFEAARESIAEIKPWMSWCHDDYAVEETRHWLALLPGWWEQDYNYSFLVTAAEDGAVLGCCNLGRVNRVDLLANVAYWVRSGRTRRGVATRAARLVARFAFERLGLVRVEIVVAEENGASLRVAAKTGAVREGVLRNRLVAGGNIYNAVMHSLVPQDFGLTETVNSEQ